ncbi:hypothetical protein [Bifidobacterium psychraerophilum]|jgi:hypothetical protein|nr:hypothetical protein [Bifidobacterium psychraerophilum]
MLKTTDCLFPLYLYYGCRKIAHFSQEVQMSNEEDAQKQFEEIPDAAVEFGNSIMREPWGSIFRAHLNSLIFRLLVRLGKIDLAQSGAEPGGERIGCLKINENNA